MSIAYEPRRPQVPERLRVTTTRRQPRRPIPDLADMDDRITALEAQGDTRGRAQQVARLRLRWRHLERDRAMSHTATWLTEARNLALGIESEERYREATYVH